MTTLLLARAGVPCVLFEKNSSISTHPKAMGITRRTAEIYRQLGILDAMMEKDFSARDCALMIWVKSLIGEELGRAEIPELRTPHSPCTPFHCPQTHTEKVLLEALRAEPLATLCFRHEVQRIEHDERSVLLTVQSEGGSFVCRAEWAVAADGAGSRMRRQCGIEAGGPGDMGHFLNTYFRADFGGAMKGRLSLLYNVLREDVVEFFVSVNGRDEWLMHHFLMPGETQETYPPEKLIALIRSASGVADLQPEILSVCEWVMSPKVAVDYRSGRIFLTGDAAARLSPAGGLGMNTGLQSAHNLAWKLAAVVKGEAGERLLDTYHSERHTVAMKVMRLTNQNSSEIYDEVQLALAGKFEELREYIARSHRHRPAHGLDIGVTYEEGAFIPDGTPPPQLEDPVNDYYPTARPGARFPHLNLRDRKRGLLSTLDFVGLGFVLFAGDGAPQGLEQACEKVIRLGERGDFQPEDANWREVLGIDSDGAVLVRPDGYVGWRKQEGATAAEVKGALHAILGL